MSLDLLRPDVLRTARDLAVIDDAAHSLRLAAARLTGLVARAGGTAAAATWSAPSAEVFGERADELRRAFARAEAVADDAVAAARRARAEVSGRVGP
jgi:hypothetical protein